MLRVVLALSVWGATRDAGAETPAGEESGRQPFRVYFVGNSVTDTVKYGLFADMAKAKGRPVAWGRHMIPGAPLFGMLETAREGKTSGFTEKPYGNCVEALTNHVWDAVSLQPFDRRLVAETDATDKPQGDIVVVQKFLDMILAKSPDAQVYLYARWPRCYVNGKGVSYNKDAFDKNVRGVTPAGTEKPSVTLDDYAVAWNTPYTNGWGQQLESKSYFETLLAEVRKRNPAMKKPVLVVPVGYVMDELNTMMKAGQVPGFKDIHDVYADGIHLNAVGSYLCAATFYATMFRDNPKGLDARLYKVEDERLAETINGAVWKVVSGHPWTGVAK
jgi:hypothetical protein